VGDVRLCPYYVSASLPVMSELCVPLVVGNRVIGVLNAESYDLDYFGAADERLLVAVAGTLATAIEKVRLLETERYRLQELEFRQAELQALAQISRQQLRTRTA
jgi:GAF domain-containing protein